MVNQPKTAHFIGIGGIGMSAAAKLLHARGVAVSGSDLSEGRAVEELREMGITVAIGHDAVHVPEGIELAVCSSAIPEDNPERVAAGAAGARVASYPELLGELSRSHSTIVVTGTHGKSTTTAMLGLMLEAAGYDPTIIVGTFVPGLPEGNLRVGSGRFLVVEGCEYRGNVLNLDPEMVVLTNIEADHLDYYRDVDHVRETFQELVDKMAGKGLVIWNGDDEHSRRLSIGRGVRIGGEGAYRVGEREVGNGIQSAPLYRDEAGDEDPGEIRLRVPGAFNLMNALAATAAAMELGVPFETCQRVLEAFPGVWRRFEHAGEHAGAPVISDYGHHPTAVAATVEAAREHFPGKRLVHCFQPHQHSRTKELFEEFVEALQGADHVILAEIYGVAGRSEGEHVSSAQLVETIREKNPDLNIRYAADLDAAEALCRELSGEDAVFLIQGAGDIDRVARNLAAE